MKFNLKFGSTILLMWGLVLLTSAKHRHLYHHRSRSSPLLPFRLNIDPCDGFACYPPSGNLLVGRENNLSASSTCGLRGPQRYCSVGIDSYKKCYLCDSRRSQLNHKVDKIVRSYSETEILSPRGWWQAENGVEDVTVQLDLESVFDISAIVLTFQSYRPKAMYIEKSFDFGETWKVARYFAHNCSEAFPGIPQKSHHLTEIICESRYSNIFPSSHGEVIYRVFSPRLPIADPYAEEIQSLMKATNIRLRFTQLHTLNGDDPSGENKHNYYHTLQEFVVRGTCRCNGHSSKCIPKDKNEEKLNMVYATCECVHNTTGDHCHMCDDEYNFPWKPSSAGVCKNVE